MLNRNALEKELDEVLLQWSEQHPAKTLQSLFKKRNQRWLNLGLEIASQTDNYDTGLMQSYIALLSRIAQDTKVKIQDLALLLKTSSPANHANLPVILATQRKDSIAMQHYIRLLQIIANRRDVTPEDMMQLICHQYSFEIGTDEKPTLDTSNILIEITCMLDDKTLHDFLQLLVALQSNNMFENHGISRLLKAPNSFQENIGELITSRHKNPEILLLLAELLNKCKQLQPEEHLPKQTDSSTLLASINEQSLQKRMTYYRHATEANHPLHYLMSDRQAEVKQLFAIARQQKLLETIEQMSAHDQINACMDALNPKTQLGAITFAADSPGMIERLNTIKSHAQELDVNGSELLADIFSRGNISGEVISFANTGTGLFQPERIDTKYDEELGNVIQQGFASSH